MINFEYTRLSDQTAVINALSKDINAKLIAGGTNLVDLMKHGIEAPPRLIDINNLSLKEIGEINNGVHIGALALNSELAEHPVIVQKYPLLSMALKAGASPQIRHMATVGGNMMQRTRCSYFYDLSMPCNKRQPGTGCGALNGYNRMHAIFGASDQCIAVHPSDMCIALAALDAVVIVSNPKGERRIPFTDFHRLPGNEPQKDNTLEKNELITAVEIPSNDFYSHAHYLKIRDRNSYAFALVSVAAALSLSGNTIKDARLAMGGVAHKPWRLREAEKSLTGKPATTASFKEAAAVAMKNAKAYKYNQFKLTMAPNAIVEALNKAATSTSLRTS
jgi:xanthine dehydrogenase YagS FAD-binding subunit